MPVAGEVGFLLECQSIVHPGQLGCLAKLLLRRLIGSLDNGRPYLLGKFLVGIRGRCQFAANPAFCHILVSAHSIINIVPGSVKKLLIGFLDFHDSLVGVVDRITAQLR